MYNLVVVRLCLTLARSTNLWLLHGVTNQDLNDLCSSYFCPRLVKFCFRRVKRPPMSRKELLMAKAKKLLKNKPHLQMQKIERVTMLDSYISLAVYV